MPARQRPRVDQATRPYNENLATYRKTLQTAFREVNDAIVNLHDYANEEAAFAAQVEASRRAYDLAQTRYASGYSGYLDVLDTQRTFNAAQLLYLASRKNRLSARRSICSRRSAAAGKPRRTTRDSVG
jgi:multidrug efflux system outer membrane protein